MEVYYARLLALVPIHYGSAEAWSPGGQGGQTVTDF